jgi:3-deoxy-D-manno-octulosonate 8-phosphate phosphatase (KDO 8-P phosphatase)
VSIPREIAARIELIVFDADGVLTDGGIFVGEDADGRTFALQRFDVQDGLGIAMLRRAGFKLAVVSSRRSAAVRARAEELGIAEIHQVDPFTKVAVVEELALREGVDWAGIACLGDDLTDLALMEKVALPAAVANAVPEVRRVARWEATVEGGRGAVREFAEALLGARGEWDLRVEEYLEACRRGP